MTVVLGQVAALAGIAAYGAVVLTDRTPSDSFVSIGAAILLTLFGWAVFSWRVITRQIFHPYVLFLVSVLLFHGGQLVLELFGLNEHGILRDRYSTEPLLRALMLVLLGMWAFHAGALAVAWRLTRQRRRYLPHGSTDPQVVSARIVGLTLVGVAAIPFLLVMREWLQLRERDAYIAFYQQEATVGLENWKLVLSQFLVPGAFFLIAGAERRKALLSISLVCVFALSVTWFLVGARSHAVMPLISAAWLWHTRVRRLPTWSLVAAAVLFLGIVFPILSVVRNNPLGEEPLAASFRSAYLSVDNPLIASVSEMGESLRPVVDTLDLVPSNRPYALGAGYVHALLNVFPNFLSFLHFPLKYGTPDMWYVETVDPEYAKVGGAWGYSFIAEAYLEFGWVGAPFALAVLGAAIAWFSLWGSNSMHAAKAAAVAAWWIVLLHFPRGPLEGYTRQLVWWSIIPYILILVLSKRYRGRAGPNVQDPAL
jgi:oligosaccharide repeat unit polymerase